MSDEKTEPPTPKRIRDAKKKGNFFFSKEIVSASTMVMVLISLSFGWKWALGFLTEAVENALAHTGGIPFEIALISTLTSILILLFSVAAMTYGASMLAGIVASVFQTGPVFSPAKLTKGLQALNLINNAKETFSKKRLFGLFMNIVKVIVVVLTALLLMRHFLADYILTSSCGFGCAMAMGKTGLGFLGWIVALIFIPVAILDALVERHFYLKNLRMSIDEVKREYKEAEGSPEIKSQRRQIHQEILSDSMGERSRKASVMVTNPTHFAVALYYDAETTPLPIILGKGEGTLALYLMQIAREENIPLYESPPLARQLYHEGELEAFIDSEFIEPVAEIMLFVEQLRAEEASA